MYACSGSRDVKNQTGRCERVVGDSGALADWQIDVGVACGDDSDALGGERRANMRGEVDGDVLLQDVACNARAVVGASVGSVDHDRKGRLHGDAVCWRSRQRGQIGFAGRNRRR